MSPVTQDASIETRTPFTDLVLLLFMNCGIGSVDSMPRPTVPKSEMYSALLPKKTCSTASAIANCIRNLQYISFLFHCHSCKGLLLTC